MLVSQFLLDIARDLNDAEPGREFTTWSQPQLLSYYNEAVCNAFTLRPNSFTKTIVMKLVPGQEQEPCDCTILHKVIGQTDKDGNLLGGFLPRRSDPATYRWAKPGCAKPLSSNFKLTGYNFDPLENGLFSVYPPVPVNQDIYIKIVCATPPSMLSMSDLEDSVEDCRTTTAAKQWVLFRALMVDDESSTSMQAAQIHLRLFFDLLNVQYTREMAQQLGVTILPGPAKKR